MDFQLHTTIHTEADLLLAACHPSQDKHHDVAHFPKPETRFMGILKECLKWSERPLCGWAKAV